jgi:hypothetical protein
MFMSRCHDKIVDIMIKATKMIFDIKRNEIWLNRLMNAVKYYDKNLCENFEIIRFEWFFIANEIRYFVLKNNDQKRNVKILKFRDIICSLIYQLETDDYLYNQNI